MTEQRDAAKLAKKRDKLSAKLAKKQKPSSRATTSSSAPAERSAAAAERQARLQTYRVVLALLALLIGVAMLLLTMRPWDSWRQNAAPEDTSKQSTPATE